MIKVNQKAPEFKAKVFHENRIKEISLSDYRGKWVVLFFYPADFTFICPTELGDLADNYYKLREMNVEVISISTDTEFVHKAWHDSSDTIRKIQFPMLADPNARICKEYGTYIEEEGLSTRANIIINPDGIIKAFEMSDNSIGRSTQELIRKIQAAKFVEEHGGESLS
jgi:peroxiredoxin (alkyl hydroperoxide reductase subunit C)